MSDIPKGQVKSTLDCWSSYHLVLLDKRASDATTFVTECGSYHYLRAHQSFHASRDHYTKGKYEDSLGKLFWTGFEVTADYYKPTKNMLQSISNFLVPKNITDVRSSFGLIEQMSYAFSKSLVLHPFRELLKKKSDFYWSQELTDLFISARSYIVDKLWYRSQAARHGRLQIPLGLREGLLSGGRGGSCNYQGEDVLPGKPQSLGRRGPQAPALHYG